jgi:hypothetical protein
VAPPVKRRPSARDQSIVSRAVELAAKLGGSGALSDTKKPERSRDVR